MPNIIVIFAFRASLVPVFSFGENDLFKQADNPVGSTLRSFQEKFKHMFGFAPPVFYGRGVFNYTFGLIPFRKPIHTVGKCHENTGWVKGSCRVIVACAFVSVGKPIDVPKVDEPDKETVDKYHKMSTDALSDLFDQHKVRFGVREEKKLNFV